jgi:acyl dehydratase
MEGVSYSQRYFEEISEGDQLPRVEEFVGFRRVIMTPGATGDYFPGHHDPEYARAQGQPTIYLNTMHIMGFIDRMVTDWAGPATFLVRRRVRLRHSLYAGDTLVGAGGVIARRREDADGRVRHLIDVELSVDNQQGTCCASASVTAAVPSRSGDPGFPRRL